MTNSNQLLESAMNLKSKFIEKRRFVGDLVDFAYDGVYVECIFEEVTWRQCDVVCVKFIGCHFVANKFENSRFSECVFDQATFSARTNFVDVFIDNCIFSDAKISGFSFINCELTDNAFNGLSAGELAIANSRLNCNTWVDSRVDSFVAVSSNVVGDSFSMFKAGAIKFQSCILERIVFGEIEVVDFDVLGDVARNFRLFSSKIERLAINSISIGGVSIDSCQIKCFECGRGSRLSAGVVIRSDVNEFLLDDAVLDGFRIQLCGLIGFSLKKALIVNAYLQNLVVGELVMMESVWRNIELFDASINSLQLSSVLICDSALLGQDKSAWSRADLRGVKFDIKKNKMHESWWARFDQKFVFSKFNGGI